MADPRPAPDWLAHARRALDEDEAQHDVTTALVGDAGRTTATGRLVAEERAVVAGLPIIEAAFSVVAAPCSVDVSVNDGDWVEEGAIFAAVTSTAAAMLAVERVVLNYIQHLSAVATAARRAADEVAGTGAVVTDTRKTTPGLRDVEKYAVRVGGGVNHRFSLRDGVLWKDNHWEMLDASGGSLRDALAAAPAGIPVQVEVESHAQFRRALEAGAVLLLVDNQEPSTVREWKREAGPDVILEASGGITVQQVAAYARAGADRISMGSLTHSAGAISIRLDVTCEPA